jgi:hypothetical protein
LNGVTFKFLANTKRANDQRPASCFGERDTYHFQLSNSLMETERRKACAPATFNQPFYHEFIVRLQSWIDLAEV